MTNESFWICFLRSSRTPGKFCRLHCPNRRVRAYRSNTEQATTIGLFGAPNCVVGGEIFWGEEVLQDAIEWARVRPELLGLSPDLP